MNLVVTRQSVAAAAVMLAAPVVVPLGVAPAAGEESASTAVRGWTVALDRSAVSRKGQQVKGRPTFETVGVTWSGGDDPRVEVRTRADGVWSGWQDADQLVAGRKAATEPLWVGTSDAVRVRVAEWRKDLEVVMVDPGEQQEQPEEQTATRTARMATTTTITTTTAAATDRRRPRHAPMPRLRLRADWGANERLRTSDPVYLDRIKQVHVHHTAGKNGYSREEVPGIIRSMYWYHTKQLGWSDLGYNFLVDRFGRIWVGRAGGYRKRVRGAHTLGFNHASFGVAAIGNYDKARGNERLKGAITRLVAWKLDREGRAPAGRVRIYSKGSDRFPKGTRLKLPAIGSHRRTNLTACPGDNLYEFIPRLRERAQARADLWG